MGSYKQVAFPEEDSVPSICPYHPINTEPPGKMWISRVLLAGEKAGYMYGPGSREMQNRGLQGLTLKSLKHHVALQPLFIIMGLGITFVAAYIARLGSKTTDINWRKVKDPNVMESYRGKQFKMLNPMGVDYSKYGLEAPKYQEDEETNIF